MATLPTTNSVESTFRPAFEEISRRAEAAKTLSADVSPVAPAYFARSAEAYNAPFEIPGQSFMLVSMGTAVLGPRPVDVTRPALRVYGGFPTREDAREHSELIATLDDGCSLIVVRQGEWIVMPQNERIRDDAEANKQRCQKKLQCFRAKQADDVDSFRKCVAEQVERPLPSSMNTEPEDKDEQEEAEQLVYKPPKRIRSGAEVRGQTILAMCVIPDEFGECLFKLLGCFESTVEADRWIQNIGSRRITDDDIFVASTCEWIYPNGDPKEGTNHYRIKELQLIMDAAEKNPQLVQSYKEWKEAQDGSERAFASLAPEEESTQERMEEV